MFNNKLEGNLQFFDICFGVFIGYLVFKGTQNIVASIVVGILMFLAMSNLKLNLKDSNKNSKK